MQTVRRKGEAVSYDLGVFYSERPHSDEDAGERYVALCSEENKEPWVEPSPRVAAFYQELIARFPDDGGERDPWSAGPLDRSAGHVIMSMPFGMADKIERFVIELAEKHGLVCFNPQGGNIVAAPPGIHVAGTEPTADDLEREMKGRNWAWIAFIDGVLKPRGFNRRRRIWRRDGPNIIAALEFDDAGDVREIWLYIWFKARGKIDPADVGPGRGRHIVQDLRDILPRKAQLGLSHVLEPMMYHAGLDPADPEKRPRWEVAFRALLEDHALPWFDKIEGSPRDYYGWGRFWRWLRSKSGGSRA